MKKFLPEKVRVEKPTRIGQNRPGEWETVLKDGIRPAIFDSAEAAEKFVAAEDISGARIVPISTPPRQEIKLQRKVDYVEEKRQNYD